jgi:hypothetical protein
MLEAGPCADDAAVPMFLNTDHHDPGLWQAGATSADAALALLPPWIAERSTASLVRKTWIP